MIAELSEKFANCFNGKKPQLISRSSGRAELIGGHTDYNEGFVIAAAIDRSFYVTAAAVPFLGQHWQCYQIHRD